MSASSSSYINSDDSEVYAGALPSGRGCVYIATNPGYRIGWHGDNYYIYKEKKMTEIQKGDVVKITGNTNSSANEVGDVGVVGEGHSFSDSKKVHVIGRKQSRNYTRLGEMVLLAREGSVLQDCDNDYVKVLSVCKAGVETSTYHDTREGAGADDTIRNYISFEDLPHHNLVEDTKVKEVTLSEIAKKFGVSVEEIRVKE